MGDVSGAAAGTWFTVLIGAVTTAAAGVAKHWVDAHFKRRARELELLAEREKEERENEALAPLRAEIIRLSAERNQAIERAAELEYSAKVSADEAAGLGEDVRRLAGEKALAEQERDEEMRKRVAAEAEAADWKRLAEEAERREALETAKKHADRVTPKEAHDAERATREPGRTGDAAGTGPATGYRPPRPGDPSSRPTVPVPRLPAK